MLNWRKFFRRPKGERWTYSQADLPWFDQPNALEILYQRRQHEDLSAEDFSLLEQWVTDGYCVLPLSVSPDLLDKMVLDLDAVWTTNTALEGLIIADLRTSKGAPPAAMPHTEFLSFPIEIRMKMKTWSTWRIHEFFKYSPACRQIHDNPEFLRIASLLFGRPAHAEYTINFAYGSRQALHQDSAVFHLFPPNYVAGLWLACEDIVQESGPLVFYPGSHKEPFFPGFNNYPQTNLKTCSKAMSARYQDYINQLSTRYERKQFLALKGQVLFWHGMLIHGGDSVIDPERTRHSYVCHYVPPGMKQDHRIQGPFNW